MKQNLPGIKVKTPYVAKHYVDHKHDWKQATKYKYGAVFDLHVCMDHDKPVVEPYDMRIEDKSQLQGTLEYKTRSIRS